MKYALRRTARDVRYRPRPTTSELGGVSTRWPHVTHGLCIATVFLGSCGTNTVGLSCMQPNMLTEHGP